MLKSVRMKNLRSLVDTGEIELKPLNILVGKNSSGKSTFLRSFPLMKQTLETRTNEPILWYSSRYVDFGSFEESVNRKSEEYINFGFEFSVPRHVLFELIPNHYRRSRMRYHRNRKKKGNYYNIKVSIDCKEKFIEKFNIDFEDHNFTIYFKKKEKISKLTISGFDYEVTKMNVFYPNESSSLFPRIMIEDGEPNVTCTQYFTNKLSSKINGLTSTETDPDTLEEFIDEIIIGSSTDILESLRNNLSSKELSDIFKNLEIDDKRFTEMKRLIIGRHINWILMFLNFYLQKCFSKVHYIAPVRARAERYYRIQGLSVDEIDPQGENIPMILNNMSEDEKNEFSEWMSKHFDFQISTKLEGGHTSLRIKYNNSKEETNLADTGFGNSQVLPIILLLWQMSNNKIISRVTDPLDIFTLDIYSFIPNILVLEQPELHLHPALQAKLIDTIVSILRYSKKKKIPLNIIIETHSESIINRIGYHISRSFEGFSADDVNVVIFNKGESFDTTLDVTRFNERGKLVSWPIGFFSPEDF